jgi:polysaccharide export outer membrane protein
LVATALAVGAIAVTIGCSTADNGGPALTAAPSPSEQAALSSADAGSQSASGVEASAAADLSSEDYKIAPRDILQVTVFQVPDLTRTVQVDNTGFVTLPLINDIRVSGRTMRQAQDEITAKLAKSYLRNPQVSLSLIKSGQRVTMNGAVRTPQVITVEGELTLSQAIAQSGGANDVANPERIHVARVAGGRVDDQVYNLNEIQSGKVNDPSLRGGDIVIVEESQTKVAIKNVKDLLPFAAIGALASDVRLKRDIRPLYVRDDGIGVYRYRYIWSDALYVGVLAQEVQEVRPDAVVRGADGYLRVDYERLGMQMQTCKIWMASRTPSQQNLNCRS